MRRLGCDLFLVDTTMCSDEFPNVLAGDDFIGTWKSADGCHGQAFENLPHAAAGLGFADWGRGRRRFLGGSVGADDTFVAVAFGTSRDGGLAGGHAGVQCLGSFYGVLREIF